MWINCSKLPCPNKFLMPVQELLTCCNLWLTPNSSLAHSKHPPTVTLNTVSLAASVFSAKPLSAVSHCFLSTYPHLLRCLCWTELNSINILTKDSPRCLAVLWDFCCWNTDNISPHVKVKQITGVCCPWLFVLCFVSFGFNSLASHTDYGKSKTCQKQINKSPHLVWILQVPIPY